MSRRATSSGTYLEDIHPWIPVSNGRYHIGYMLVHDVKAATSFVEIIQHAVLLHVLEHVVIVSNDLKEVVTNGFHEASIRARIVSNGCVSLYLSNISPLLGRRTS